jgi:thiol-disulfide isomerase/thioredoxin
MEPRALPTTLAISTGDVARCERPAPGIYAISATAIDLQPDHRGAPIVGRALRVVAIDRQSPTTAPLVVEIPSRPYLHLHDSAPEFSTTTLEGKSLKLSSLRGQWVVVSFWATWCPPCVEELPALQSIHDAFPTVNIIGASFDDDVPELRKFLAAKKEYAWTQCVLAPIEKSPVPHDWGVQVVPALFLVDPEGRIAGSYLSTDDLHALLDSIKKAAASRQAPH